MGFKICSFASGSTGNCIYLCSDTTRILIDVGIAVSRVENSLMALKSGGEVSAVLVTHSHSDHISNVPSFLSRHNCDVYAHYNTAAALTTVNPARLHTFGDADFYVGDITVSPFPVSHDVPCVGYSFLCGGKKISVATDLGVIDEELLARLSDSDVVFLECNHDEELLRVNKRYVPWLKRRILSSKGHLSNRACAEAAVWLAKGGVKEIMLGHLSRDNNYPELAYNVVRARLDEAGFDELRVRLEVARADRLSTPIEVM